MIEQSPSKPIPAEFSVVSCRSDDACLRPVVAQGWCRKHYLQEWRAGRIVKVQPAFRSKADCHPERKHLAHGLCRSCYYKGNYALAPVSKQAKWARENPERRAAHHRKSRYGLDDAALAALLVSQGDGCAICSTPITLATLDVDHHHVTNLVRGLLCRRCNIGIGMFGDDPVRLRAAADYTAISTVPTDPL